MAEALDVMSLTRRLERIERRNSLNMYTGAAVAMLLVSLWMFGWVGRSADRVNPEPALLGSGGTLSEGRFVSLATQEFRVEDPKGRVRASIVVGHEEHTERQPVQLTLYDETAQSSIELSAGGVLGPALDVGVNGHSRARLGMNGADPILQLMDERGKVSAVLWFMNGSPHLVLSDDAGRSRAVFGYDAAWHGGPSRPASPAPSVIAIYDEKGKVVWSATQAEAQNR